jgi:hypothetical protein
LNAYAAADRIRIDVEDHCGGLPQGAVEDMFLPFKQSGEDRSGLGLGLAICRRSVDNNAGSLGGYTVGMPGMAAYAAAKVGPVLHLASDASSFITRHRAAGRWRRVATPGGLPEGL